MPLKVFDMGLVNEWKATSGEFLAACKKPGAGAPSADSLPKWLVSAMYLTILSSCVTVTYPFVSGCEGIGCPTLAGGIQNVVVTILYSLLYTWINWFMFVKKEPACCCCLVFCFDGDSWICPVVGGLTTLGGASGLIFTLMGIPGVLAYPLQYMIVSLVWTGLYVLYLVCLVAIGLSIFKKGGGAKGAEAAANATAEKVGA
jgi:hypothetical protein